MARGGTSSVRRTRVSVDLPPETRRGLRLASEGLLTLNAQTDPVLAELWDNASDSAYDRA